MKYFLNLFTPETYEAFGRSDRSISGFRESQRQMAEKLQPGDKLICYMVRMSRWIGVFEVINGPFIDKTPIFVPNDDPYTMRFKVKATVWLPLEKTIPIREQEVYSKLTFTRNAKSGEYWLGPLRRSLNLLDEQDGSFLDNLLHRINSEQRTFDIDREQYQRALKQRIQRQDRSIVVSVPEEHDRQADEVIPSTPQDRESIQVQATLCQIGEALGFTIWLPPADALVLRICGNQSTKARFLKSSL